MMSAKTSPDSRSTQRGLSNRREAFLFSLRVPTSGIRRVVNCSAVNRSFQEFRALPVSTTTGKAPVRGAWMATANERAAAMTEAATAVLSQYLKTTGRRPGSLDSIFFQVSGEGSISGRAFRRDNAD